VTVDRREFTKLIKRVGYGTKRKSANHLTNELIDIELLFTHYFLLIHFKVMARQLPGLEFIINTQFYTIVTLRIVGYWPIFKRSRLKLKYEYAINTYF